MSAEDFGEVIRSLMAERSMSLRALAREIPLDAGQLSRVLNGYRRVTPLIAQRCEEIFGPELLTGLSSDHIAPVRGRVDRATANISQRMSESTFGGVPMPSEPRPAQGLQDMRQMQEVEAGELAESGLSFLHQVRSSLSDALASSSVAPRELDLIEDSVATQVMTYPSASPTEVLSNLVTECLEVERLSRSRQPAAVQARLSGAAALLATMCADALMRLGVVPQAQLWYRTALMAADDSGRPALRVLVRAQAAMLPYYFGDPQQTVALAESAIELSTTVYPATALAAAARARALARLGASDAARSAMRQAQSIFDQVGETDSDEAFRFPPKRLLLYLSGAATWLGDLPFATRIQDEALALYESAPTSVIDPGLIRLDQAMCLVQQRRSGEAAHLAIRAVSALPQKQRTDLVLARANDVIEMIPLGQRLGEVAQADEYLRVCRAQARSRTRSLASGAGPSVTVGA